MPKPGHFILHSHAIPPLPAGAYTVGVTQTITAPNASVAPLDSHIEVTAPRFAMPADQILSTFPPNQSEGLYSSRLPQCVLRRRTLPWDRAVDDHHTPWLALVVLADAEAELRPSQPIAQCVTSGVTLAGRSDVAVGDAITVTERVVNQVFPTAAELPYLTHVREVDLNDTELALGDDDGWLAVVLSNRLPQPGVRYRACLISLEGQLDVLPDPADITDEFEHVLVYPEFALHADVLTAYYSSIPDDSPAARVTADELVTLVAAGELPAAAGVKARAQTQIDAWSSKFDATSASAKLAPVSKTAELIGDLHAIDMQFIEPLAKRYTFPLLAHWTFTCSGSGDFQALMEGLDVGMLGTIPPAPPAPVAGAKPPPPPSRPEPALLDTGHIALAHTTRGGEPAEVWYRGPLVPRPVTRTQPAGGLLPLLHTSDQARRVGPDGRENLALAVAFEIGRLLALAEPSVVAALLTWRKDGYDAARRGVHISKDELLRHLLDANIGTGFAALAGNSLITKLGAANAKLLGPPRPPFDPGRPLPEIDDAELLQTLSVGFALEPELLSELAEPGVVHRMGGVEAAAVDPAASDLDTVAKLAERELGDLRATAAAGAAELAESMLRAREDHR
jgi:hypothetical protein